MVGCHKNMTSQEQVSKLWVLEIVGALQAKVTEGKFTGMSCLPFYE